MPAIKIPLQCMDHELLFHSNRGPVLYNFQDITK